MMKRFYKMMKQVYKIEKHASKRIFSPLIINIYHFKDPQVYNLYSSCAHGYPKHPWFVALSRTGRPRRGKSTRRGQSSTHFVLIDGGNRQGNPLDSLGHAQSRADWLINWKNFYGKVDHEHKIRGRKKLSTSNNIKKGRLRWELLKSVDGVSELRKRRSDHKIKTGKEK
uniref:Ribosomal protein L15 n=1 Tax=Meloidogyne hapla TaxID=6305 RepID=A0A1I8BR13_MELHA